MPKTFTVDNVNDLQWYLNHGTRVLNDVDFVADGVRYRAQAASCIEVSDAYAANNPPHLVTDDLLLSTHIWNLVWKHKQKPRHGFWKQWDDNRLEYTQPGTDNVLEETAIWLPIDEYSYNNPWHVWVDQLSKLVVLYNVYDEKFWQWPLLVPFKNKYFVDAVKSINPEAKIIEIPKNEYWYCKNLIVPTLTNIEDGIVHPLSILYLRNKLSKFQSKPTKKLYISRKNAKLRNIHNEEEVIELLTKHGYETVYPEKLSVEAQLALFGSASHIVGVHGAGLTNMLSSPRDCHIIELYHKDRNKKVYPVLARHCGHQMIRLQCDSLPVAVQEKSNTKIKDQVDLIVDCKILSQFTR